MSLTCRYSHIHKLGVAPITIFIMFTVQDSKKEDNAQHSIQ